MVSINCQSYLTLVFFTYTTNGINLDFAKKLLILLKNEKKFDHVFTIGFNEPSLLFLTSHLSLNDISFNDLTSEDINNKNIIFIMTKLIVEKWKVELSLKVLI